MVSVICNTFNQESYIRDALNSFVMQKTNFKFEVLVHDDASTDNTPKIVKEFEEKHPDIIKPIYQTENQYSKKIPITKTYGISRAQGKYIALCEGDDYWTDPYKLQKQFDALESHTEVDMCAHSSNLFYANKPGKVVKIFRPRKSDGILSTEEVILGGGGFVATNSLFFRKSLYENEPPFRKLLNLDYTLQILGSMSGGIYFLSDNMSDYRYLSKGSWTKTHTENKSFNSVEHKKIKMLLQFDSDTDKKYTETVKLAIKKSRFAILRNDNNNREMLKAEFRECFKALSFIERLKIRLKAYFPFLLTIKNSIK